MLPLVLIVLGAILLAIIVLGSATFLRAAFGEEADAATDTGSDTRWRPPFLRGDALRTWAASTTKLLATRRLTGQRTETTAVQIAKDVEDGALRAMLPLARQAEMERLVACPAIGQGAIGVTVVEILAIAADLRSRLSPGEQQRLHDRAAKNSETLALNRISGRASPQLPCPLQGDHNVCCTYAARPLQCRPLHARSVARSMGSRRSQNGGFLDETATHEEIVAEGVELGLVQALASAHLDAHRYELNSALAKALEMPDAAERWAQGDDIFASCTRLDSFTNETVGSGLDI